VLQGLLFLTPVLALAIPLLARRYPGERALVALRTARRSRRRRPSLVVTSHARVLVQAVRGGLLIGCSLAVRPPPLAPTAS
jgi:hypothetical protein